MVDLKHRAAPLLKQVRNLSRDAYDRQQHQPPSSRGSSNGASAKRRGEPDVDDDPVSSSSDSEYGAGSPVDLVQTLAPSSSGNSNGACVGKVSKSSFKQPARRSKRHLADSESQEVPSSGSANKRRKSSGSFQAKTGDEDEFWQMRSQSQQSRDASFHAKGYGRSSQRAYGSSSISSSGNGIQNLHTTAQRKATNRDVGDEPSSAGKSASAFKTVPELSLLEDHGSRNRANFKRPEGMDDPFSSSQVDSSAAAADILKELDEEAALADRADVDAEDDDEVPSGKSRCPYCKDVIDADFVDDHSDSAKRRWRDVEAFCLSHRRRDAQVAYKERGYANIKWRSLEARFEGRKGSLRPLLNNKQASYFRNELEEQLATRRGRKNKPDLEVAGAGYYGTRGGRRMLDWLQGAFAERMVQLAAKDALVMDIGKATFLQAVMVPELAVMLIMQDLGCDVERARATLRESGEVGDLVNAEEEEHVTERRDGEDDGEEVERYAPEVIDLS